jgi:hypothetical protein
MSYSECQTGTSCSVFISGAVPAAIRAQLTFPATFTACLAGLRILGGVCPYPPMHQGHDAMRAVDWVWAASNVAILAAGDPVIRRLPVSAAASKCTLPCNGQLVNCEWSMNGIERQLVSDRLSALACAKFS